MEIEQRNVSQHMKQAVEGYSVRFSPDGLHGILLDEEVPDVVEITIEDFSGHSGLCIRRYLNMLFQNSGRLWATKTAGIVEF